MKPFPSILRPVVAIATAGLALAAWTGCGPSAPPPAPKPAAPAAKPAAAAPANKAVDMSQFKSVFEDDLPFPKARDPFYPNVNPPPGYPKKVAAIARMTPGATPSASLLTLKGIVGSGTQKLAIINNEILAAGESGSARLPDGTGKLRIKCLEIGDNYVVLQVEGQTEPKRLNLKP